MKDIEWRSDIPKEIINCFIDLFERVEALEKHQVAEYKVFKYYYYDYIERKKKANNEKIEINKNFISNW